MKQVKINSLELENIKRIKAVKLQPTENGLTVVGGKNAQGKTSVLDAIAWALGGNSFKPSNPHRDGSMSDPHLKVTLSNGLIVERKGKSGTLKVTDPEGKKAGQTLLDEFIEKLALNLPKFMAMNSKDKANTLLQIVGVGEELGKLDNLENKLKQERLTTGQIASQKEKYAEELEEFDNVPNELIDISEMIDQINELQAENEKVIKERGELENMKSKREQLTADVEEAAHRLDVLKEQLVELDKAYEERVAKNKKQGLSLYDVTPLQNSLSEAEEVNQKIRSNQEKAKAIEEAKAYKKEYSEYTKKIKKVQRDRISLLNSSDLPLPGLGVDNGELTYNGQKWDGMSGAEQLKVSTAIVKKLNPQCGFVLIDKLEQMDTDTLQEFGEWLEGEGLQAIATRVSTGGECSIIIEDGEAVEPEKKQDEQPAPKWTAGKF